VVNRRPPWDSDEDRLPTIYEAAQGLYFYYRDECQLDHGAAFAATVEQLIELFPEVAPRNLNIKALGAARIGRQMISDRGDRQVPWALLKLPPS
jgi:hypothetical protein